MRVGFVGLGDQGAPIAGRIADNFDTVVWARREAPLEPFRGKATIAATPAEVGESVDVLGSCLFDGPANDEVLFGPNGAATTMKPGGIIIVHSTVLPGEVLELNQKAAERGLRLVDAPVSGGGYKAAAGELVVMLGGDEATVDEVRPIISTFSNLMVYLGGVGAGQQAKLINNTLLVSNAAVAADAFAIADQLGLNREGLAQILTNGSGRSFGAQMVSAAGALQFMATSQAYPTLSKDVALLAKLVQERSVTGSEPPVLLPVAEGLIAQLTKIANAS